MEFRSHRRTARGLHSHAFRSVSQHVLSGDQKSRSTVVLRKLAATIRVKGVGERPEGAGPRGIAPKEKTALTDPRFRRERTRSPKKPCQSRSESRFTHSHEKTASHSTPIIPKAAVFRGRSHQTTPRQPGDADKADGGAQAESVKAPSEKTQPAAETPAPPRDVHAAKMQQWETQVAKMQQLEVPVMKAQQPETTPLVRLHQQQQLEQEDAETNDEQDELVSLSLENHVNSLVKSLLSNGDDEEENVSNESPDKDDSVASTKSSVQSFKRRRNNSWGGNQVNPQRNPLLHDPRVMKRYAYMLTKGTKRNSSAENLHTASPPPPPPAKRGKPPRDRCGCVKCVPYTEEVLKEHFKMPVLFLTGSGIAVVLMAFIAWVLSNDFIWDFVNGSNMKEPERRNTLVYVVASYIGGATLFTINIIFGTIYNLFVLPRNAVFKSADEPWNPWQYINLK